MSHPYGIAVAIIQMLGIAGTQFETGRRRGHAFRARRRIFETVGSEPAFGELGGSARYFMVLTDMRTITLVFVVLIALSTMVRGHQRQFKPLPTEPLPAVNVP
jgi:hypothetical protein